MMCTQGDVTGSGYGSLPGSQLVFVPFLSLLGVSSLYLLDFRAKAALRLLLLNAFACLEGVTGLFPGDSLLWMWLSSRSSIEF